MEFNCAAAPERFVAVARALGEPVDRCSVLEGAALAAQAVRRLAETSGSRRGFRRTASREAHVAGVVEEAMKSGNVVVNPRQTTGEQLADILRRAM